MSEEVAKTEMKLNRIVISFGSRFMGQTIQQSGIRQDFHCLVVGVERDGSDSLVAPNPQAPFHVGDILWVVGEEEDLLALEQANAESAADPHLAPLKPHQ